MTLVILIMYMKIFDALNYNKMFTVEDKIL